MLSFTKNLMDKTGFWLNKFAANLVFRYLNHISLEGFCIGEYESGKDYLNHFLFFNPLEAEHESKMIQTWLIALQIGLSLLIRYDDTVKIEATNDAVMTYSPLRFLSYILRD